MSEDSRTVVVASTRPWNRGMADRVAERTGCRVELIAQPSELTPDRMAAIRPEYVFFPHWSTRIPATIHERFECVIFHMTDVPFGRGGSPLQNLIVRKINETQISAIRCLEEMDAGPVYLKRPLSLHGSAEEILLRASGVIEEMIEQIVAARPDPVPQEGEVTTFTRRGPDDGDLAAVGTLDEIFDYIRMLDAEGYPPAFLDVGPFRLEFSRASRKVDEVRADVRIRPIETVRRDP